MNMVLAFLVAVVVVWVLCRPHVLKAPAELISAKKRRKNAIEEQRRLCIQVLRDLELDFATKKISEADYRRMKDSLSVELSGVLEELDSVREG